MKPSQFDMARKRTEAARILASDDKRIATRADMNAPPGYVPATKRMERVRWTKHGATWFALAWATAATVAAIWGWVT
jgi:hypothetical protein